MIHVELTASRPDVVLDLGDRARRWSAMATVMRAAKSALDSVGAELSDFGTDGRTCDFGWTVADLDTATALEVVVRRAFTNAGWMNVAITLRGIE